MKSNLANVALLLISGLIAGAAFAQSTPEQMPTVQMAGESGGKMMDCSDDSKNVKMKPANRDKTMDKNPSGKGAVRGTMNPKIRVY